MPDKALLVLEDGSVFTGRPFGASARAEGEVVFCNELHRGLKPAAWGCSRSDH